MAPDWVDTYLDSDDRNERYELLRKEMKRLRNELTSEHFDEDSVNLEDIDEFYLPDEVADSIRELNEQVEGDLYVFAANDFGLPAAFRPESRERDSQNKIRQAILNSKYNEDPEDLNAIRQQLRESHPGIHKAIVAEFGIEGIRYYLPEGSNMGTNFLTVREMVGIIDYTTNSFQAEHLSYTY